MLKESTTSTEIKEKTTPELFPVDQHNGFPIRSGVKLKLLGSSTSSEEEEDALPSNRQRLPLVEALIPDTTVRSAISEFVQEGWILLEEYKLSFIGEIQKQVVKTTFTSLLQAYMLLFDPNWVRVSGPKCEGYY